MPTYEISYRPGRTCCGRRQPSKKVQIEADGPEEAKKKLQKTIPNTPISYELIQEVQ